MVVVIVVVVVVVVIVVMMVEEPTTFHTGGIYNYTPEANDVSTVCNDATIPFSRIIIIILTYLLTYSTVQSPS